MANWSIFHWSSKQSALPCLDSRRDEVDRRRCRRCWRDIDWRCVDRIGPVASALVGRRTRRKPDRYRLGGIGPVAGHWRIGDEVDWHRQLGVAALQIGWPRNHSDRRRKSGVGPLADWRSAASVPARQRELILLPIKGHASEVAGRSTSSTSILRDANWHPLDRHWRTLIGARLGRRAAVAAVDKGSALLKRVDATRMRHVVGDRVGNSELPDRPSVLLLLIWPSVASKRV